VESRGNGTGPGRAFHGQAGPMDEEEAVFQDSASGSAAAAAAAAAVGRGPWSVHIRGSCLAQASSNGHCWLLATAKAQVDRLAVTASVCAYKTVHVASASTAHGGQVLPSDPQALAKHDGRPVDYYTP
jgi:hypothetical protein